MKALPFMVKGPEKLNMRWVSFQEGVRFSERTREAGTPDAEPFGAAVVSAELDSTPLPAITTAAAATAPGTAQRMEEGEVLHDVHPPRAAGSVDPPEGGVTALRGGFNRLAAAHNVGRVLQPDYPIETERLLLRPLDPDDVDDLHAYQSRADVCRYIPYEPRTRDRSRNGSPTRTEPARRSTRRAR